MSESLDRFTGLLRTIFELDKSDLDFGIYRIMKIRRKQIEEFLSVGLPKQITSILEKAADEKDEIKRGLDAAFDFFFTKLPEKLSFLKDHFGTTIDLPALEADTYTYLYNFFSRYYDEGDFISKRRYKEGVYAIPYEGEEIKLYWANHDQYYIKTSDNFKDYSFISEGVIVHFMLTDATTEQNNNKENGKKRAFMLFTENEEQPGIKTFEKKDNEIIIRFSYDLSEETQKALDLKNHEVIKNYIVHNHDKLIHLITPSITYNKVQISVIQKHLYRYVAKNTFDYFIHKDLSGFLNRELDFFIKNEIINLDDMDTANEKRVNQYLTKVRAVKRVGKVIIDFLAQIENFQKRLWIKKKFVIRTDWCITLDRVPEELYEEICNNKAQVREWIDLYAIDEVIPNGDLSLAEKWTNPPTVEFLKANKNLVIDTRHFNPLFKDRIISEIDNLDEETNGILIQGENFQALSMLYSRYYGNIECIHIDPPYNTETSGFLYKNNYKHASWLSMMNDRIDRGIYLLNDNASFITHIDENEYERLWQLFDTKPLLATSTIIWDKRNPMTGGSGIATQHEYIIWRDKNIKTINICNGAAELMLRKVKELLSKYCYISDELKKEYTQWLNSNDILSTGEKAYRYIDDNGNIYQSVSLRAPEPRTDPKFHIPLIHPKTKKPCPVPPNGFSRTPETMKNMIEHEEILFGEDESTQPRQKSILREDKTRQLTSVIQDAIRGKSDLLKLGLDFPYNHSVNLYENLLSSAVNNTKPIVLDYFAGSATTGHAVVNLNRQDEGNRKYILVEVGDYFNSVTKPRMQKVVYAKDWKDGKPTSRHTGVSHIMKYFTLESYEDTLTNIEFTDTLEDKSSIFGNEYILRYMLDKETQDSLLNVNKFKEPFDYLLKITERNEVKEIAIDLVETFNYLIGINVVRIDTIHYFMAISNYDREYEGSVDLKEDKNGKYLFKQIEGTLNDGSRILIIWRNISENIFESDTALDAYFLRYRRRSDDRNFDTVYVNGDNNLEVMKPDNENWKVKIIETEFLEKMFED